MGGEFWGKELTAHLGIPVEMSWARAVAARAETATAYFMMEAGAGETRGFRVYEDGDDSEILQGRR